MRYEPYLFFAILGVVAALPAYAVARMPGLRAHSVWVKGLVFAGTAILLLPLALAPALMIMLCVFGIDMLD